MLQCEHELHIWLVISASSDCIKWRWCCILTLVTEWILFTVTYFTPGFNEGALWALQMFESSGHLPFLQETIFLLDFYWCKWFCCLQEGMLSTTFPIPVDMCFLLPDYIQPCPQVSVRHNCIYSCSKYCTQPFPNIPVPIPFGYATGVGDQEACANVQGCAKYILIKLVSLMMKCWKYGKLGVQR